MVAPVVLLSLMFLLIFGPKSNGWIDVVSIASGVVALGHFLFCPTSHVPDRVKVRIATLLSIFVLLFGYAAAHWFLQFEGSNYQVLRFGRVIVNYLGVACLVSFYVRRYRAEASQVVCRHLFHCLVLHATLMLAMFASNSVRDWIVNQVVQTDPDSRTYLAKLTGYRISGLTDSWDALSGLQSLGVLALPILLTQAGGISYGYAAVSAPLLLFSIAISGRTGFVTAAALAPLALYFADLKKLYRATAVALVVTLCGVALVTGPLRETTEMALNDSSLGRTLAIFGREVGQDELREGGLSDTFTNILGEHYFLPSDTPTLIWGTGGSGRDSWDYIPADNGIVLNLHNLGVGCWLLIYCVVGFCAWCGWRVRRHCRALAGWCVLSAALMMLIDCKVMYVLSRNGFSVMMLPVLASWFELDAMAGSLAVKTAEVGPWGSFERHRRIAPAVQGR